MAFGGNNPGIWGESVRTALNPGEEHSAHEHEATVEQQSLDAAELRELERSEFYHEAAQAPKATRLRRILDRVFRR